MSITDALDAQGDNLIQAMIDVLRADQGGEAEIKQFVVAFHGIMAAAAAGDMGPRDEYLASVVPPLRASGLPLTMMVTGLIRMATVSAALLGQPHAAWLAGFFSDYAAELLKWWEQA